MPAFPSRVITAIAGGRPGMISAATAATAVLMVTLVKDHGLQYLLAATVLAGLLQIGMGLAAAGLRDALCVEIGDDGVCQRAGDPDLHGAIAGTGPGQGYLADLCDGRGGAGDHLSFPRLTKAVPSPLVTIVVLTALTHGLWLDVRTVGDMGALPDTLPMFLLPDVPLTFDTLQIIFPYALAVAVVGLLESLMTQSLVDDLTDTKTDRNQECIGQGLANTATGFIGGMAGCAMIGQSMINVKSGGRGRLSCALPG